jgi:maltose alpha-D-glucosyltransferase/alpha-amylase
MTMDRSDPLWFKDAVIYQLHVKAFYDANDDGVGDFAGLMQKLDYVQSLGVTAIWLLPFYPSPLKDDGYDIADYRDVHPAYGKMADFRHLVRAAHERGLRVIIELVINHTSDQHPWFQRARRAKKGSPWRDYYVWSDDDQKYQGTRIIFLDTEKSNWTWDPEAQAYFWHRFYSHQPDLNFDNPRVVREVMNLMHFWLDMGVDGLRLDAVPYLVEREGTNNENLAETHAILKQIRAEMDAHYPDRMLLAEANQWPEDVQEYFGRGDECDMAFHFPLMPRMYMAIAQEDRHPITDIMRQTPEIPDNCQWAIFLRNHDELTLEMVTNDERDYLWNFYAADRRMRINLGIRRRLAPLMENDRRKIELLNSLLLSMPGTPVIYYGDEIGMGDNIFLGDRDGVRTPMQWTPDRNGGFSRADPARLYLPPIMDPMYGFAAMNVEAQQRHSFSLLNWMRRMISERQQHKAFGRGKLTFLYPGNRKVLAYLRTFDGEIILCVANLSRSPQAVQLDLGQCRGRVPVELVGRSVFPPIGELPYLLTLAGYGFHWFMLEEAAEAPRWADSALPTALPELVTLVLRSGWDDVVQGRMADQLALDVLPQWLMNQRWFSGKDAGVAEARIVDWSPLPGGDGGYMLARAEVKPRGAGPSQLYFVPLALAWGADASNGSLLSFTLAKVRRGAQTGLLHGAMADDRFSLALLDAMREERAHGAVHFWKTRRFDEIELPAEVEIRRQTGEQSNTSALIGELAVLKIYRRLVSGTHPELEIGRFLTEVADFHNTPPLLAAAEHVGADGERTALAIVQGFVRNQGDGWSYTLDYLDRALEDVRLASPEVLEPSLDRYGIYLQQAATLGRRTAEMHRALATPTDDPAFRVEPMRAADLQAWRAGVRRQAEAAFAALAGSEEGRAVLERREDILARIDAMTDFTPTSARSRLHGDYHLGQVLVVKDDWFIIDFEGEPARALDERRAKRSPLSDVAGMLRSFDYAAHSAAARAPDADTAARMRPHLTLWRDAASAAFLDAYRSSAAGSPGFPEDPAEAQRLIALFTLEKAFYEIVYEAANRPSWIGIPAAGALSALEATYGG